MTEKTLQEARLIIAGFLKQRRIELGMTQSELAQKTGLARKTIYSMEAGKFWLGLKQYLILCEALHLFPAIAEMEANTPIAEALRKKLGSAGKGYEPGRSDKTKRKAAYQEW